MVRRSPRRLWEGTRRRCAFPRPLLGRRDRHRFAFSFSGLKTAAARYVEAREGRVARRDGGDALVGSSPDATPADVAASFQEAVVDVLTAKAVDACRHTGTETLLVVGGVAANSRLRALAEERCAAAGVQLRVPTPALCTDNGAMIAALGDHLHRAGVSPAGLGLAADPCAVLERSSLG